MDIQQIDTERILGEPTIGLDQEYWLQYLKGSDMRDCDKAECVLTVWNAMYAVASLGYRQNPIQQVDADCGQLEKSSSKSQADSDKLLI